MNSKTDDFYASQRVIVDDCEIVRLDDGNWRMTSAVDEAFELCQPNDVLRDLEICPGHDGAEMFDNIISLRTVLEGSLDKVELITKTEPNHPYYYMAIGMMKGRR